MKKLFTLLMFLSIGAFSFGQTLPGAPYYTISTVTTVDAQGEPDSNRVYCIIIGQVLGVDIQGGSNIGITVVDATGGIALFAGGGRGFGFVPQEGDSILVRGTISQFNGLTQISPDSALLIKTGIPLNFGPQLVTNLSESTESELVRINDVYLSNPSQWSTAGGSFNFTLSDGTNTYTGRIDSDVDIAGSAAPLGTFDLIGIGGQFDGSAPYIDGYQILPRYMSDIVLPPTIEFASALTTADESAGTAMIACNIANPIGSFDAVFRITEDPGLGTADYNIPLAAGSTTTFSATVPAANSFTMAVNITDDLLIEGDEGFGLEIISVNNGASIGAQAASDFLILDNDFPPSVEFASAFVSASEAIGTVTVTIQSANAIGTTNIDFLITEGPGISTSDYQIQGLAPATTSVQAPIAAGITTFNIYINDDMAIEGNEQVTITMVNAGSWNLGGNDSYTLEIVDNDFPPSVGFAQMISTIGEADGVAMIEVMPANAMGTARIDFLITEGVGINSSDYNLPGHAGSVTTFSKVISAPAVGTSNMIAVNINDDMDIEGNETIAFNIINAGAWNIGAADNHELTIIDNDMAPPVSSVEFAAAIGTIAENGGSFNVALNLSNAVGTTEIGMVVIDGPGMSSSEYNIAGLSGAIPTFSVFATAGAVNTFDINIVDDLLLEGDEDLTLIMWAATNGYQIGAVSTFTLTVVDDEIFIPTYNIDLISSVDANGDVDSATVYCKAIGTVVGLDLGGTFNDIFTIIDNTGGIGVFKSGGFTNYTVKEGDLVRVIGTVTAFRGLTQIGADSIVLISSGNPIPAQMVVTALNESTESEYIQLNNVALTGGWPAPGSSQTLTVANAINTYLLRVDSDSEVDELDRPNGEFSIIGTGGQFDSSSPFTSGYQIVPHFDHHIIASTHDLLEVQKDTIICIEGDGTQTVDFSWTSSDEQGAGPVTYAFMIDTPNQNFKDPVISIPVGTAGTDTFFSWDYAAISQILNTGGHNLGDTAAQEWTIRATNTLYSDWPEGRIVRFKKGVITSTPILSKSEFKVYPNPSTGFVRIDVQNSEGIRQFNISVFDMKGTLVSSKRNNFGTSYMDLSSLANGTYVLSISTDGEVSRRRLTIVK